MATHNVSLKLLYQSGLSSQFRICVVLLGLKTRGESLKKQGIRWKFGWPPADKVINIQVAKNDF